jgi:hypothetical protein
MSYTTTSLQNMRARAVEDNKVTRKLINRFKKIRPQQLDKLFHDLHATEFKRIDCLECANCCKTISPSILDSDVRRMATALKIKQAELIEKYLVADTDNDFVFKNTPCPFLEADNRCIIYEARPKACREYPHTDRKRIYQILDLTVKNSKVCPAVFTITEKLKNSLPL